VGAKGQCFLFSVSLNPEKVAGPAQFQTPEIYMKTFMFGALKTQYLPTYIAYDSEQASQALSQKAQLLEFPLPFSTFFPLLLHLPATSP
jgi:hypothetical protein